MRQRRGRPILPSAPGPYDRFSLLDGTHPWRETAPDGYIDYPARFRPGGRVLYFNFPLARELGLVPQGHENGMNAVLEARILDTFSLQIINEYDLAHPERMKGARLKPNPYMATRYLQLQHRDKCGRTSGDGRSIWNGAIESNGVRFDVSSRGTGATILSPGASEANRPLATGETKFGYASGTADLDEMLGSALMSEIFYREGIPTERCLTVIDYGDGSSVGVRTAPNLVRPAHLFRYLKMGRHAELKRAMDYFLERQEKNGFWKLPADPAARSARGLDHIARSYGKLAAVMEEEYIFNWLSWDGDNVLADGSILDYGSIRQFAAKSNKYRYEDVDRFSTSLGEQRYWARLMVQAFAQAADFVLTGGKKKLRAFREAPCLAEFDREFRDERDRRLLWRFGFAGVQIDRLMEKSREDISGFRRALAYFEDLKVAKGPEKLPDGITHRPVFLIRNLLRELPRFYAGAAGGMDEDMDPDRFCRIMAASYAGKRDLEMTPARAAHVHEFQDRYRKLIRAAEARAGNRGEDALRVIAERSATINLEHRLTGDGLVWIIGEIMAVKDRLEWDELQDALDAFIDSQVLIPGKWKPIPEGDLRSPRLKGRLLRKIKADLELYKETV
ncbi:MAG TPA: hypothetical protein VJ385_22765 [Fibrobacteria bacterium]|nr:hypothetical protein [Fibrobacteria bacterium]